MSIIVWIEGKFVKSQKKKHEGVRYPCDSCDYKATKKSNLKQHKENIYKGVRYACDSCDYNATTTDNLKKHKDFMHKGIRYSCDLCDYTATRKDHLKLHKDSIHEGVRYSCDTLIIRHQQWANINKISIKVSDILVIIVIIT